MDLSDAGARVLLDDEGAVRYWYTDALGMWTLGMGHFGDPDVEYTDVQMRRRGLIVREGRLLTEHELLALFRQDQRRYIDAVNAALTVAVRPEVFDVLVRFAFNWGIDSRLGFPATSVVARVNAGDVEGAAYELTHGHGPPHSKWPHGRPYNKGLDAVQERWEREARRLRASAPLVDHRAHLVVLVAV